MMLKGYRTIALNSVGVIVALAAGLGIGLDADQVTEVVLGFFAFLNIILRLDTDSKVGGK